MQIFFLYIHTATPCPSPAGPAPSRLPGRSGSSGFWLGDRKRLLRAEQELQEQAKEIEKNINLQINNAKQKTDEQIKKTISSLQDEVSSKLNTIDRELEEKISNSEKQIIKNRDSQMKNINDEIANITKITVAKISDLRLSDNDINQAIKILKGKLN